MNALLSGNNFLNTDDFRRLIVPYLPNDVLMTIRLVSKPWSRVADRFISDSVESGTMVVRGEKDFTNIGWSYTGFEERYELVTRVIFLLNITKVGKCVCYLSYNLVVVDIPEGVERIGNSAFFECRSLTTVSFPTTLTSIGSATFFKCSSLDNVILLHTNLQEIGAGTFQLCSELKSMTIPDSLQTLRDTVFADCSKPVPSNINVNSYVNNKPNDTTSEVVACLRAQQTTP
ncbi:hypothetical protein TL16_g10683 [Triparma laevis f. inornata]|uniref:Uncharacterized protein n=1 Tax=Triparma laevis f. inornata TaxID=1714386 RepID=A0A9W7BFU5_9STRA|nr:hypothetical protein TL16_g10683 [Triparma laevis f. inornata]